MTNLIAIPALIDPDVCTHLNMVQQKTTTSEVNCLLVKVTVTGGKGYLLVDAVLGRFDDMYCAPSISMLTASQ